MLSTARPQLDLLLRSWLVLAILSSEACSLDFPDATELTESLHCKHNIGVSEFRSLALWGQRDGAPRTRGTRGTNSTVVVCKPLVETSKAMLFSKQ